MWWELYYLTFYFVGFKVEVLQAGGDSRNSGKFVVRKIQFHQTGEVEDLRVEATALKTTAT